MNQRVDKLNRSCPYTRVEWLENVGWSRVFLPVFPQAGDVVEIESELCYSDVSFRQSELAGIVEPWFFWGVYDTSTWYAGGKDTLYSQVSADTEWHVFRLVSLGTEAGFWVDDRKIIDIKQYPGVVYAPDGIELWSYSNGRRNSLNKKKWLRITINGRLAMHLLPVLDDNGTPALYDTVSRQLFYNTGEDELVAGPRVMAPGYTALEYIESVRGEIAAPQSYIKVPVSANLLMDSLAFETEHELSVEPFAQAEGANVYDPMIFYGVRDTGVAYYGLGYANSNKVMNGVGLESGFVVHRVEYEAGVLHCYMNGKCVVSIARGLPSSDMLVKELGVFVAVGKPIVETQHSGSAYPFNGKKKYFKVWVNGVLERHLVPVLDTAGVPCMYDLLSSRFYYSEGESDFIAGPVSQP